MKNPADPMIRDKKSLPLSDWTIYPQFAFRVLVVVPFVLIPLIPITVLSQIVIMGLKSISKRPVTDGSVEEENVLLSSDLSANTGKQSRALDIVVFGATGFTGRLAALYIAKMYSDTPDYKLKWGIAGRRKEALEELRKELAEKYGKHLLSIPIIIADSNDSKSLTDMVGISIQPPK